jgi:hypothetical protein
MKKQLLFAFFLSFSTANFAQTWTDARSRWSDSFAEWILFSTTDSTDSKVPLPEETGRLTLRFPNKNDWTEWNFEGADWRGSIRQTWPDNPNVWTLRANGASISMRTKWNGELREWVLTDDRHTLNLKIRFQSADEWLVDDWKFGRFYMYTLYENDPRDWAIEDNLTSEISPEMRLALTFLVLFNSSPTE